MCAKSCSSDQNRNRWTVEFKAELTKCSGKAKVTELHNSAPGHENVFRLDIAVDDLPQIYEKQKIGEERWRSYSEKLCPFASRKPPPVFIAWTAYQDCKKCPYTALFSWFIWEYGELVEHGLQANTQSTTTNERFLHACMHACTDTDNSYTCTHTHTQHTHTHAYQNHVSIDHVILTLCEWQKSIPFKTCQRQRLTWLESIPFGHLSKSSSTVWSTNSKTRKSRFFRRKTSIRLTKFSWCSCWKRGDNQNDACESSINDRLLLVIKICIGMHANARRHGNRHVHVYGSAQLMITTWVSRKCLCNSHGFSIWSAAVYSDGVFWVLVWSRLPFEKNWK